MSSPIPPKLQNAVVVAWPPPLESLTFDTTNLQHFDAAERAPSTASLVDIAVHSKLGIRRNPPRVCRMYVSVGLN
jgi:hypothetical protein